MRRRAKPAKAKVSSEARDLEKRLAEALGFSEALTERKPDEYLRDICLKRSAML